jgi:hypothetical protein
MKLSHFFRVALAGLVSIPFPLAMLTDDTVHSQPGTAAIHPQEKQTSKT